VSPAVVWWSEIWAMTEMDTKRLGKWEREILRRIHRPVVEQGMWSIRSYQELRKRGPVVEPGMWRIRSNEELRELGTVVEPGMWRIRSNQELREMRKDLDIVADIKKGKIGMYWTCSKNGSGMDS